MKLKRKTRFSAGADLSSSETVVIKPFSRVVIGTGYRLPDLNIEDVYFQLHIRSSLSFKYGLMLTNGVGVIDLDYRDEIKVMITNPTDKEVAINKGDRIAQLVPSFYMSEFFDYEDNERVGGFGSTGK